MRLLDIKRNINIACEKFKYSNDTYNGSHRIKDIQNLKTALIALRESNFYTENTSKLIDNILSSGTDYLLFSADQINLALRELEIIQKTIETLFYWVNKYIPCEEDESTVNIKLPTLCKVDDLIKASTIINKALSQSISEIGGEIKIKHLDYGSSWIIISAGTAIGASLVVAIANVAFSITQKYYGVKMMQQQYERYKLGRMR